MIGTSSNDPEVSFVIPFFNEEAAIPDLAAELHKLADAWEGPVEVLLVDDGSTDGTLVALRTVARAWPACRVLRHETNLGQAAALLHGIREARAPLIGTMDGDGQNVPDDLLKMRPLLDLADLVVGIRTDRHDSGLRRWMSRVANAVRRRLLRDAVYDSGCAIKLFRSEVARSFLPIRTLYSFMPALAISQGFRVTQVPVLHRERRHGRSNYGLRAMWLLPLLDLLAIAWLLRRGVPRQTTAGP